MWQDKGIHDGRRTDSGKSTKNLTTVADRALQMSKHIVEDAPPTFSAMSPCGTPTTIRAVHQITPSAANATLEVAVQLRIAEGHTSDGIIKDVEFLFHIGRDDFNVRTAPCVCVWNNLSTLHVFRWWPQK